MRERQNTAEMVTAALVVALMGAAAYLMLPLGAVPVTLQVFVVVLAALLLPVRWAAGAMGLYLVLGAAGLPIFSGGQGGLGVIAGPTGGYLIGFALAAPAASMIRGFLERRAPAMIVDLAAAVTAIVAIYLVGTVQLAIVTGMDARAAVFAGVVPFLALDAAKAAVAIAIATSVRRARGQVIPAVRAERP